MGIEGNLKQLSPYVLQKLKEEPGLVRVFTYARFISEIDVMKGRQIRLHRKKLNEIKADIPLVIAEGKTEGLDIHKYWHQIHFLLTGDSSSWECSLSYLIKENPDGDNLLYVNAIMGGRAIEEYDRDYKPVRYLTPDEVKQVAVALSKISEAEFRERYDRAVDINPKVYLANWGNEYDLESLEDVFYEIKQYYQDAAERGNAMLLWLS